MTDSKTPEWAREAAQAFHDKWETGMSGAAFRDLAQALLSAYERGRREGIDEAAKVADRIGNQRSELRYLSILHGKPAAVDVGYVGYTIRQLLEVKG